MDIRTEMQSGSLSPTMKRRWDNIFRYILNDGSFPVPPIVMRQPDGLSPIDGTHRVAVLSALRLMPEVVFAAKKLAKPPTIRWSGWADTKTESFQARDRDESSRCGAPFRSRIGIRRILRARRCRGRPRLRPLRLRARLDVRGIPIEPIPMVAMPILDLGYWPYTIRVRDGVHHFYTSIAAGPKYLPLDCDL